MENSFLPSNYKSPKGNYAKFEQGENTFRVLGHATVGYVYWTADNKPIRSREEPVGVPSDIRIEDDGKYSIKHFWMFPVWNYDANKIQLMEVTQQGIRESIKALVNNPKWGDPMSYDITITKDGTGFDTTYNVMPNPHSVIDTAISDKFSAMLLNVDAIFDEGGDPFKSL